MGSINSRTCAICGNAFIPSSNRQRYCKTLHYRICPVCGKSYPEPNLDKFKFPPTTCSMECRVKQREQTSLQKYGIKAPGNNPTAREKSKQTMQARYGVDYAQSSKEIRQKSKDAWIQKYGVDNPQKCEAIKHKTANTNLAKYGSPTYLTSDEGKKQIEDIMLSRYGTTIPLRNPEIKDKCRTTNLTKYGVENPAQSKEVQGKMRSTSRIRYGTDYPSSSPAVKQHVKETFIRNYGVDNCFKSEQIISKIRHTFITKYGVNGVMEVKEIADRIRATNMKKYGVPYYVMLPKVSKSSGRISKINQRVSDMLSAHGIYNRLETTIENQSYDISISQGNILIEVNPSYTHSVCGNHWNPKGIDKYYHLRKTILAENHGYRCMHLWDWDSTSKFINSLTVKTTIYHKASPKIISAEEAKTFMKKYSLYDITENIDHILFIGIRYKTKLMTLMGFRQMYPNTGIWTILSIDQRFNYAVHNGYLTILSQFIQWCNPHKIIAYADYSKTNGELLENLGFEYTQFILPNKIWSKGRHAIADDKSIVPEMMLTDGWLPVYNCGYKVYELLPEHK